jgi:hypothetical protein
MFYFGAPGLNTTRGCGLTNSAINCPIVEDFRATLTRLDRRATISFNGKAE